MVSKNSATLALAIQKYGFVAQLNRASDYGSEGSGFESQRSHRLKRKTSFVFLFFFVRPAWVYSNGRKFLSRPNNGKVLWGANSPCFCLIIYILKLNDVNLKKYLFEYLDVLKKFVSLQMKLIL